MGKISRTWSLMGASWEILKQDKEMLFFPFISGICCLLVMASFAIPLFISDNWRPPGGEAPTTQQIVYYLVLFLFYFCNYFVIVFFNSAIIACAVIRMGGGDPTVGDGFRAALARLPLIAGWALISASFGLLLRIIEDRSEKIGQIVASLLGMAWTAVSFLVIPILVIEKKNPISAFKESAALLKKTWGEELISNFSYGLIFFLLSIPAFLLIGVGIFIGTGVVIILCISVAVIYLIVLALIESTLQAIFRAALYLYARNGQVPGGFQPELLQNAIAQR